ncbi:MAG: hypothetical protein WDA28_13225 [Castellaniella sp.]
MKSRFVTLLEYAIAEKNLKRVEMFVDEFLQSGELVRATFYNEILNGSEGQLLGSKPQLSRIRWLINSLRGYSRFNPAVERICSAILIRQTENLAEPKIAAGGETFTCWRINFFFGDFMLYHATRDELLRLSRLNLTPPNREKISAALNIVSK